MTVRTYLTSINFSLEKDFEFFLKAIHNLTYFSLIMDNKNINLLIQIYDESEISYYQTQNLEDTFLQTYYRDE